MLPKFLNAVPAKNAQLCISTFRFKLLKAKLTMMHPKTTKTIRIKLLSLIKNKRNIINYFQILFIVIPIREKDIFVTTRVIRISTR